MDEERLRCQRQFAHKAGSPTRQPCWGAGVGPQRQCKKDGQEGGMGPVRAVAGNVVAAIVLGIVVVVIVRANVPKLASPPAAEAHG